MHHCFPREMTSKPGTSAEILTRGSKFSTSEKHYRDLGSDRSSVSFLRSHHVEKPVMQGRSGMSAVFSPGYDLTRGPQLRIAPAARGSPRIYNFMVQTVINRLNIWCQLSCSSLPSDFTNMKFFNGDESSLFNRSSKSRERTIPMSGPFSVNTSDRT